MVSSKFVSIISLYINPISQVLDMYVAYNAMIHDSWVVQESAKYITNFDQWSIRIFLSIKTIAWRFDGLINDQCVNSVPISDVHEQNVCSTMDLHLTLICHMHIEMGKLKM